MATEPPKTKRKRRWLRFSFRFTIKTILVVTLLVSVWLAIYAQRSAVQRRLITSVGELKGSTSYEFEWHDDVEPPPKWIRQLLGDDFLLNVASIHLSGTDLTDAQLGELLPYLEQCHKLDTLDLSHTRITDGGLNDLQSCSGIRVLYINDACVTDDGLKYLEGFESLSCVGINTDLLTDIGLRNLAKIKNLIVLDLGDGEFDMEALVSKLPHISISY
ncbi:MAG: hypothetical protein IH991_07965 [Planctomycetes bacterium]|nr:hypothetical protein [Planctomycetota bacterium]